MPLLAVLGFEDFERRVRLLKVDDSTICRQEDMICKDGISSLRMGQDVEAKVSTGLHP